MKQNIEGKVIVITGASSGIGEATAIMLAAQGAKVVLGARRKDRLEKLVDRIKADGGEAVYLVTDIKKYEELVRLVGLACEVYGHLDVLVNNAGIARLSRIDDLQIGDWEEMIDVNLKGTLYGMAAALPVFKKQGVIATAINKKHTENCLILRYMIIRFKDMYVLISAGNADLYIQIYSINQIFFSQKKNNLTGICSGPQCSVTS